MIPQEIKLLDLLSNNDVTFFIPPYQRNYEWTDEQCKIFLEDVIRIYKANINGTQTEHFFGSITYFKTESPFGQPAKLVLIDGQQRITTTMLFLVALRDILGSKKTGTHIDSRFLKNNNVAGDREYKIKLKQVETDWDAYKKIVLGGILMNKQKSSAVYRNYKYFHNKLLEYQANGIVMGTLIEKGLSKFSVITIELQPERNAWENPQEIFESMNSIGKPLSLADLVRNYLLLGLDANQQLSLYEQYWLPIEQKLPGQVSNFIRDYMQARGCCAYPKATESNNKELYGIFKGLFAGENPQILLEDLLKFADFYAYITQDIACGNKRIERKLQDLRTLNVSTAHSFLLVLLNAWKQQEFTPTEVADILDAFLVYCLRRRLLALTKAESRNFPLLSKQLDDLKCAKNKKNKMFEILTSQGAAMRLPNDTEVMHILENMNFYSFNYCKFYLTLIEEKITKSRPDLLDEKLQIEHIMPQTLNRAWMKTLGKDYKKIHQELLHTIGNLTLIRHNQELSNETFDNKKKIYENNAGLQIAKTMITNQTNWTAESIRARTNWLSEFLIQEVLVIPNNMRHTNNYAVKKKSTFSFKALQLIGHEISYIGDSSIRAKIIDDKNVEFEGKKWDLLKLTKEILKRKEKDIPTGVQIWNHWEFDGTSLEDLI